RSEQQAESNTFQQPAPAFVALRVDGRDGDHGDEDPDKQPRQIAGSVHGGAVDVGVLLEFARDQQSVDEKPVHDVRDGCGYGGRDKTPEVHTSSLRRRSAKAVALHLPVNARLKPSRSMAPPGAETSWSAKALAERKESSGFARRRERWFRAVRRPPAAGP